MKITKEISISIKPIQQNEHLVQIIGNTPIIFNRMSEKVKRDLLIGSRRKTEADKKKIKHNVIDDYKASVHKQIDAKTFLGFPSTGIKGAMGTAAIETEGVAKTNVNRLIFLPDEYIPIYGKPLLSMAVVRTAGISKAPDIRTRCMIREWCSEFKIRFAVPTFDKTSIFSLITNAGFMCGIGDNRQEKGKGNFGTFSLISTKEDKAKFEKIKKLGYYYQKKEMQKELPNFSDEETKELYEFYQQDLIRRVA